MLSLDRTSLSRGLALLLCAAGLLAPSAEAQIRKGPKPPKPGPSASAPAASTAAAPPASTAPDQPAVAAAPAAPEAPAAGAGEAPAPPVEEKKASGWIFDGDLGVPRLKSDETSLAFDLNLGWVGKSWGFGAYVSSYTYALQQDGTINQTSKFRYGAEARYLSGEASDGRRFEGKLEFNSGAYNTTYLSVPTTNGGGAGGFNAENSTLTRFTALAGLRLAPSGALRVKLSAGLGLQTDTYFRASSGAAGGNGSDAGAQFDAASSLRLAARGRFFHDTIPGTLGLRAEVDASSFQLRRVGFFAGGAASDPGGLTVTEFRETDLGTRLFADVEKLSFFGLMPGAFVGLDYILISGDRSTSALIPIFGVGLINAAPRD